MPDHATTRRAYLRELRALVDSGSADIAGTLAGVAGRIGRARGVDAAFHLDRHLVEPSTVPAPADALLVPDLLGWSLEALLGRDERRRGSHFTPQVIADGLTALVIDQVEPSDVYCDPACGGGAFLLAIARRLESLGRDRSTIVESHLEGFDIDPLAVATSRTSLALWARVPRADAVATEGDPFGAAGHSGPYTAVLGNPPFQSQLAQLTVRRGADAARLERHSGIDAGAYTDTAWLFLAASLELARPDGVVALIQPQSLLSARDGRSTRRAIDAGQLLGLWVGDSDSFDAAVEVCAPIVRRSSAVSEVCRWSGAAFEPLPAIPVDDLTSESWAPLIGDLTGAPIVEVRSARSVADVATATAGFRDEYYGLVPAVREGAVADNSPRLMTVGLIDALQCRWGRVPARFARTRWSEPVVDLDRIVDERVRRWVSERLTPKILLATQTKTIEVVVDETGRLVPLTPIVSVHAPVDRLWHLAAALTSPPIAAVAFRRAAGSALVADALKLSASQVLALPLPIDGEAWDAGADAARSAATATDEAGYRRSMTELGHHLCDAYEVEAEPLTGWWLGRLPAYRR